MEVKAITYKEGLAKRSDNYGVMLDLAERFTGAPDITSGRLISILLNCGPLEYERDGKRCRLTSTQRLVLCSLLTWVSAEKWEKGDAFAWPGNETLATRLDVSVRAVQDALLAAETAGLALRRYDRRNGRVEGYGIDLRPLGARAGALAQLVEGLAAAQADRRRYRQQERTDILPAKDSSPPDESRTLEYNGKFFVKECTGGGEFVNSEDRAERGSSPRRSMEDGRSAAGIEAPRSGAHARHEKGWGGAGNLAENWAFLDDLASPQWVELFAKASPSFRQRVTSRVAPFPITSIRPLELVEVLRELRERYLSELNAAVWSYGLRRHGILAVAAMLVAIDKYGVKHHTRYLVGMLKKRADDKSFDPLWDLRQMAKAQDN